MGRWGRRASLLLLTLLLCGAVQQAAAQSDAYLDVPLGSWFYDDVYRCTETGLMSGTGEQRFEPKQKLTCAMFLAVLSRLDKAALPTVSGGQWYVPYADWARSRGLIGLETDVLQPISRAEMAKLLDSYLTLVGNPLPETQERAAFADLQTLPLTYRQAIGRLQRMGVLGGDADGRFGPNRTLTRAEAAAILNRLYARLSGAALPEETDALVWIYHACGSVDGVTNTNSLEALEQNYATGARLFEVDFNWSSDGKLLCIHDFNRGVNPAMTTDPVSLQTFLDMKVYGYTPLWLGTLADWMQSHPDACIITDVKDGNLDALRQIAEAYPELLPRFIPQIYAESELQPVRELGYAQVILTVYRMSWAEKTDAAHLAAFAQESALYGLTVPAELATEQYVRTLTAGGVKLFAHTVNDAEQAAQLQWMGLTGIYTDGIE